MDLSKILAELREERMNLDEAIVVLERLARGRGARRGRPPSWLTAATESVSIDPPKRRGRPPGSKNRVVPRD